MLLGKVSRKGCTGFLDAGTQEQGDFLGDFWSKKLAGLDSTGGGAEYSDRPILTSPDDLWSTDIRRAVTPPNQYDL